MEVKGVEAYSNGAVPLTKVRTELRVTSQEDTKLQRTKEAQQIYGRGRSIPLKNIKDKKLRAQLKSLEKKNADTALKLKDAEILLEHEGGFLEPENEMERTADLTQEEILKSVPIQLAQIGTFKTRPPAWTGPYIFDYTRNGRELLLAGRNGHIAAFNPRSGVASCNWEPRETIRDVRWLADGYFAAAQKKYTYIYDHQGVRIHELKKHVEVSHMEYLRHHFLLATVGMSSWLRYHDVSTGRNVAEMTTKLGGPTSLTQNPQNAILHLGHSNGTVTLWSPNASTPLVKLQAHRGPVRALAIDREGRYMVSTGQDLKMAVWDIRMYKELNNYITKAPATSVAISDKGLTAVGCDTRVKVWRGLFTEAVENFRGVMKNQRVRAPYLAWGGEGKVIERVRWLPFEDVLGVSHDKGFNHIIVPGAGEANFDALAVNPYENTKQRQEREVKELLNKLQPEMISLNPEFIGSLDTASAAQRQAERDLDKKPLDPRDVARVNKNKGRGKKRLRKKGNKNVVDEKSVAIEEAKKARAEKHKRTQLARVEELGPTLGRFERKR